MIYYTYIPLQLFCGRKATEKKSTSHNNVDIFFHPFCARFWDKNIFGSWKKELLGTLPDRVCKRVDKIEHFATKMVAIDSLNTKRLGLFFFGLVNLIEQKLVKRITAK